MIASSELWRIDVPFINFVSKILANIKKLFADIYECRI